MDQQTASLDHKYERFDEPVHLAWAFKCLSDNSQLLHEQSDAHENTVQDLAA